MPLFYYSVKLKRACQKPFQQQKMEPDPKKDSLSGKDVKSPNIFERAKEEFEAVFHHDKSPHHHKETHGRSDDIDEETSVNEIKAPNVFERVKEEIEAVVGAVHHRKDSDTHDSPRKDA